MLEKLTGWLKTHFSPKKVVAAPNLHKTGSYVAPPADLRKRKGPLPPDEFGDTENESAYRIESNGPGKNVLVRRTFRREDSKTDENLQILDDSLVDSGDESGLDPYNTGGFDRSKNWDRRYGK